jgi:hypothetical protein
MAWYYVDLVNGNDTWDGKVVAKGTGKKGPVKTIAKAMSLLDGDLTGTSAEWSVVKLSVFGWPHLGPQRVAVVVVKPA